MNYDDMAKRSAEIVELAERNGDVDVLKPMMRAFSEEIKAWADARLREAKADGRDTLHADDARTALRLRALVGDARGAVGEAVATHALGAANRARVSGGGAPSGTTAWKSIFPSMGEYKGQSINQDPAGGYLVTAEAGPFFDRLRPDSVVLAAGPRIELCESDALNIPTVASSSTAYGNTGENTEITESAVTFGTGRIPMRKYAALSTGSSEWFADAAYGPRQIIEQDHRLQLAALLDRDMLQGNTSGVVMGLRQCGTDTPLAAAGATPTLDNVLDAIYRMEANNAKPGAIFMHPRTWNTLRKLQDSQLRYQLQPDPTTGAERRLFGLPVYVSSQISITEDSTNAANHDCSWIAVVDMRYVVAVRRQAVQVLYDPFSLSKNDKVLLRSTTRWGFGVIYRAAVEVLSGVRA